MGCSLRRVRYRTAKCLRTDDVPSIVIFFDRFKLLNTLSCQVWGSKWFVTLKLLCVSMLFWLLSCLPGVLEIWLWAHCPRRSGVPRLGQSPCSKVDDKETAWSRLAFNVDPGAISNTNCPPFQNFQKRFSLDGRLMLKLRLFDPEQYSRSTGQETSCGSKYELW